MKKIRIYILLFLLLFTLTSCNDQEYINKLTQNKEDLLIQLNEKVNIYNDLVYEHTNGITVNNSELINWMDNATQFARRSILKFSIFGSDYTGVLISYNNKIYGFCYLYVEKISSLANELTIYDYADNALTKGMSISSIEGYINDGFILVEIPELDVEKNELYPVNISKTDFIDNAYVCMIKKRSETRFYKYSNEDKFGYTIEELKKLDKNSYNGVIFDFVYDLKGYMYLDKKTNEYQLLNNEKIINIIKEKLK